MAKQKILLIDNVFAPSKKDRIINGVQKFTKAQREVLSDFYEVHYITMKGSDLQFENQYILKNIQDVNLSNLEKRKITDKMTQEIYDHINMIDPDIVLDNSCKHFTRLFPHYRLGIVFEHYYRPSMPLTPKVKARFTKHKVFWAGVSRWQNEQFRNYFDGVASVQMLEQQQTAHPSEGYGMFVGRWDVGKKPHVMIKRYAKYVKNIPLHVFTTFKNCYLSDEDLQTVAKLKTNPNITFHIDKPRLELEQFMKKAAFIIGSGNESTGLVSMEGASFGVPYIVPGTNFVAEQEHMNPDAIRLLDRSHGNLGPQLADAVNELMQYSFDKRKLIAKDAYLRYNKSQFLLKQLRLIKQAKDMYG